MAKWKVDINCDVGEGVGNEAELFPYISSCNIACGGHAGDANTIRKVMKLARDHGVRVGAHPSYPDKANFGRVPMDVSLEALKESVLEQLNTFEEIADNLNIPISHIKPHGALYNQIASDTELAQWFLEVMTECRMSKRIYAPYGSAIDVLAPSKKIEVSHEVFADRNYDSLGRLVSRSRKDALIIEPEQVLNHILPMIKKGEILSVDGEVIKTKADTFCVHGDTPEAMEILHYLSRELPKHDVALNT